MSYVPLYKFNTKTFMDESVTIDEVLPMVETPVETPVEEVPTEPVAE